VIKYGWICLIVGGLLALPLNVGVGVETLTRWQWAVLSFASALGPLLTAVGFDAIADRSGGGATRSFLQVGGVGLLILGGVEIASVVLPLTGNGHAGSNLRPAYVIAAGLVVLAGLGAGVLLLRRAPVVAVPLLASAAALTLTVVPDAQWLPGYTIWALFCIVLGVALRLSRLR
jgi:hypothetical protein